MSAEQNPSEYTHTFRLNAEPARVFTALSDPNELRAWFAENVEIEPYVGGRFHFWGKHTLKTPTRAQADQILTRFDRGEGLAFYWSWDHCPTHVEWSLAPAEEGGTKLTVRQRFEGCLQDARASDLVDDHWRLVIGNLMGYLAGDGSVALPDHTDPATQVRLSIHVDAPPDQVFRALTEPELIDLWAEGATSRCEPRDGGCYSFGWTYDVEGRKVAGGPTRVLEIERDQKLVVDWPEWRGREGVEPTQVAFLLEPESGDAAGTRLTLVHSGFPRTVDRSDYQQGWMPFLSKLREVVETRCVKS